MLWGLNLIPQVELEASSDTTGNIGQNRHSIALLSDFPRIYQRKHGGASTCFGQCLHYYELQLRWAPNLL